MKHTSSPKTRVKQLQAEGDDCLASSIAFIMNIPKLYVPNFIVYEDPKDYWEALTHFLFAWGLELRETKSTKGLTLCYALEGEDEAHVFVQRNGKTVYDTYGKEMEIETRWRIVPLKYEKVDSSTD